MATMIVMIKTCLGFSGQVYLAEENAKRSKGDAGS